MLAIHARTRAMNRLIRNRLRIAAAALAFAAGGPAHALDCAGDWFEYTCERFKEAMDRGQNDIYLPFHSHHGTGTYSAEKRAELNDKTWGLGYGRSVIDSRGYWYGFYGVAFRDSHDKPEYMGGYGYQTYWGGAGSLQAGLGYTAFVTTRSDYSHYLVPVPGILPMASVRYANASLMVTYVPRLSNKGGNGDVLFLFGRINF
jgi:palmitoyl transferase